MTFSIVAVDPGNGDLGIAVQSKFPNVGVVIPFARAGVGAVATQSYCNTSFGPRGLTLLEQGAHPQQALDILTEGDPDRDFRQVGMVDAGGAAATFTGARCFDWAGGATGPGWAVQGNTLESEAVCTDMARSFREGQGPLAERLLSALAAGQAAGGDRRGQQSAALLVVRQHGGYGGHDDRYVDISVYDHERPIEELRRLYGIHRLTYLRSDPDRLITVDGALARELQALLTDRGFYQGPLSGEYDRATREAMRDFMGWENYDERIRDDDQVDLDVLDDIRTKHTAWLAARGGN